MKFTSTLWLLTIVVSLFCIAKPALSELKPVLTEAGAFRGVTQGDVEAWLAIPYAEPPVGNLRWRAPRSPKPWDGIRDAGKAGPSCMQPEVEPVSEDCLTLNIFRPAGATEPLPVMVWIHGGAMVRGGANLYPGNGLAPQGVIHVSINYRLGRLGYFAHPALLSEAPDELKANYGYMDQIAALQWVKRNIASFGGDPGNVTIFGESAGGGSVMVLLGSPLARELFHKAILQSPGTPSAREAVIPVADIEAAEQLALEYAQTLGIDSSGADALAKLRKIPATKLIEGASGAEVLAALAGGTLVPGMAMAIRDGKLLVETPQEALKTGGQARVPVMIGANDRDLALGVAGDKEALWVLFGPDADEAREAYDPGGSLSLDEAKQQVFADKLMPEPVRHFADENARAGNPTWLYRFSYVAQSQQDTLKGTMHGFEIPYVLNLPAALVGESAVIDADRAMAGLASAYWVSFAKTGDPNGEVRPHWPRHNPDVDRVANFTDAGIVVGPDPLKARLDLWKAVWDRQQ
jgi:para-nitrobenzyl esterase